MTMIKNILKTAAVAGLIGLGVSATTATPAAASNYTRCGAYGCYTVHCSWRGNCYRTSGYYGARPYYRPSGYYAPGYYYRSARVCDRWGCHYVRRGYPRSHVSVGIRF
jgi:hypothetical protein